MNTSEKPNQSDKFRMRRATIAVLVILAMATVSCSPGQIEGVLTELATPFESGYDLQSLEAGLFQAALVLSYLIPGLGLGPGLPF